MVVNKAESSNNCQAAKKFGVTESNVRRWRAPKQRLKDANSQRKSTVVLKVVVSVRLTGEFLNTSAKTRFGRSRWKRSSWGAMTARANTAGKRTCVRDWDIEVEVWRILVKFICGLYFLCYLKIFTMLLDIHFESYCTYFALKVPWLLLALILLALI